MAASRRLSGFVDARRWLALASLVALVATGCGGKGNEKRDQVTAFVDHVNSVQQDAAPSFDRANRTYLAFSKGTLAPSAAQKRLAAAERTMRRTRDDVAAVAAPQDAAELKRRVVALFDADAALAHEATLLATFVPAQQDASKSLPGLSKRLTRDLKPGPTPAAQERALSRYAHGLDRVIGRLQPLHPPPLLLQRHHDQIVHLQTVRALS